MPLSSDNETKLKTLYRALGDRALPPGDDWYVERVNRRDGSDVAGELAREIDWQAGGGVCLVTGQRGTGKSTELLRLESMLEERRASVFYVDMSEYMMPDKEVEISDFLISLCGALSDRIEERHGDIPNGGYFGRVARFLKSEVKIDEIQLSLTGASIKASLRTDEHFRRTLQEKARGHIAQLVQNAHAFIADAVAFVREKTADADASDEESKVVLIVDSIERIRGRGRDAMSVYDSVGELFFTHARELRLPALHVVYSIPPYLPVLVAGTGDLLGASPQRFYGVHTIDRETQEADPHGLALMREVVERRYPRWRDLLAEESLERLAFSSGGDLRNFFRLIQRCLPLVREDGQLPISDEIVEKTENDARAEMLPLPLEHVQWLRRIAETRDAGLERSENLPTLARFLDDGRVLVYRNGRDWYAVNPLIRQLVIEYGQEA